MGGKTLAMMLGLVAFVMASGPTDGTESLRPSIGQAYAAPRCGDAVNKHLQSLKVEADEIGNINVLPIKPPKGRTLGYRAWVSLKSCRGSLVVNLTTHCKVTDAYTRGDCRFERVPQH